MYKSGYGGGGGGVVQKSPIPDHTIMYVKIEYEMAINGNPINVRHAVQPRESEVSRPRCGTMDLHKSK